MTAGDASAAGGWAPLPVTGADIDAAAERIRAEVPPTPLLVAWELGERLDRRLLIKAEGLQRTGSFKPRGALNWIESAEPSVLEAGLVTVSGGNHATALAWAARRRGVTLTAVMPAHSSPAKVGACRRYGAEVRLEPDIDAAWATGRRIAAEEGRTLVPPYDDPWVIAGQGTVGLELDAQAGSAPLDAVLCPVGGGGLVSGVGLALRQRRPEVRLIGVEAAGAPTLRAAWDAGGPVNLERVETCAPSLGANRAGELTWRISRTVVDELVTVEEASIPPAIRSMAEHGKLYAEPAACVGLAALMSGAIDLPPKASVALIASGASLDLERFTGFLTEA